eukprot:CAMPEP_0178900410 /NCGR_PEP_ID=MMETSP0786-20121207/3460_1 /TAXON_ID=186022 /ORGANISM="Thalassionema frauenfeldii, Strain CCMP 1798" /LENGTH=775 /DNA_ID=CAMNT_0020571415 /DNA_START=94 /DNA_END=2422 /DNA_ORIENTATION=-
MSSKTTNRPKPSQGKAPAPNAWARPLKPRPPPGLTAPGKSSSNVNGSSNGTPSPLLSNPELRDRFLHLTLSLVGHRVTLTQLDGSVMEGVFHTFTPFASKDVETRNKYVLKAVSVVKKGDQSSSKLSNGSTVIIAAEKVVKLQCKSLKMSSGNGKADMFRTDTEISHAGSSEKDHNLVAAGSVWTSGAPATNRSLASRAEALIDSGSNRKGATGQSGLRGNIGEWDQFQANKELFNVHADFDENLYTTELDKSTIDASKIQRAERLAREIENTTSGNIHIAEERNQVTQDDYDEEDRYSGVLNQKMQVRSSSKDAKSVDDQQQKPKTMNYAAAAAKADAGKTAASFTAKKQDKNTTVEESSKRKQPESTDNKKDITQENNDGKSNAEDSKGKAAKEKKMEDTQKAEKKAIGKDSKNDSGDRDNNLPSGTQKELSKDKNEGSEGKDTEKESTATSSETKTDEIKEETGKKKSSKLNANAKAFTFNPSAKTFTPGSFSAPAAPSAQDPHQTVIDPNTGMPVVHPQMQGQHHYMPPAIGQPVMPMINPHFTMRYAGGYPGMEHPVTPGPHAPQHLQQPSQQQQGGQSEGSLSSTAGDEPHQTTEETQSPLQQPQSQQPPHPGVPVPYPQNAAPYPYGNLPIPQRGPGGPHMAGYPPQMVGGPQQIPVVRSGNPYGHMYSMPQHPPQMRPNSSVYYPNAPPHYQHYAINDDEYGVAVEEAELVAEEADEEEEKQAEGVGTGKITTLESKILKMEIKLRKTLRKMKLINRIRQKSIRQMV